MDIDAKTIKQEPLFDSGQFDLAKIRVRPAEFARMMSCSKQAVSMWIRDGKIALGADGRLDPGQAVGQLLKNSNVSQLRTKILKPLIRELREYRARLQVLEQDLVSTKEMAEFHEGAVEECIETFHLIEKRLFADLDELAEFDSRTVIFAFLSWFDEVRKTGDADLSITGFLPAHTPAPGEYKEGAGESILNERVSDDH